jgi:hypothetical protein
VLFVAPAQVVLASIDCSLAAEHMLSSSICFSLQPHGFERAYEASVDYNNKQEKHN